jgi:DNA-binding LacI/PurR family transcriptional regulator
MTFKDVAKAAGVSFATVSRVATNGARVSPEVAKRVTDAAQKLGVDLQRKAKTKVIGFMLSNRQILHSFHSLLLAGAEAYCTEHDYNTLFLPIHYGPKVPWRELQLPQILLRHDLVHGFILAGSNTQNLLDCLTHKRISFSVLGNNMIGEWRQQEYDVTWFDDTLGAYEIVQYLLALGHRDIWYTGNCRLPWFMRRYEGYRRAMMEAGLEPRLSDIDAEKEHDVGYLATKSILNRGDSVTAVFAGGDTAAQGVYKALRDSSLRIPEDVSVVGFNDIEAPMMHPPLTSSHVFLEQVGRNLAQLLINRIEQTDLPPQRQIIPTQLERRESCRALEISEMSLANSEGPARRP